MVRADDTGGKRTVAMDGVQFMRRLVQHEWPAGFKRICHFGPLAPAAKTDRRATARTLLAMPAANAQVRGDKQAPMRRVAVIEIARCP